MKFLVYLIAIFLFVSPVLAQGKDSLSLRNATRQDIEKRTEELKAAREQKEEEFRARLEEVKARAKEEQEERRAKLKEKLQQIKNEQKKRIVEVIEKSLNELNQRMMNHFSNVLEKLEKVLANIVSRIDKAEARGWEVLAVRAMITSAEGAIGQARSAIEVQAGKTYTPQISGDEGKLKVEAGEVRKALHNDLVAVREKVRAAFEAVRRVATTLAQVPKIDELEAPEASPSPSPTP